MFVKTRSHDCRMRGTDQVLSGVWLERMTFAPFARYKFEAHSNVAAKV